MKIETIDKKNGEYVLEIYFDNGEFIGKFKTKNINFISKFIKNGVNKVKFWTGLKEDENGTKKL